MTREDVAECLNHSKNGENNRKLLTFCREPIAYTELGRAGVKGDLFKVIADLKKSGALTFTDGKYVATQLGLDVLKSIG